MNSRFTCAFLSLLWVSGCDRGEPAAAKAQGDPAAAGPVAPTTEPASPMPNSAAVSVAVLANREASAPLTSAIERVAQLADTNGDGEVSKSEAMALSNFALGGASSGTKRFTLPASLGDIEYGKPLAISDVRFAAAALVDDLFAIADKNKSGSIAMDEARATSIEGARALGRIAFDKTDKNHDGELTEEELTQLVSAPLRQAFDLADLDNNGRLSIDEATAALRLLARTVGIPSTATSNPSGASLRSTAQAD